jgi:hypothetical protein
MTESVTKLPQIDNYYYSRNHFHYNIDNMINSMFNYLMN